MVRYYSAITASRLQGPVQDPLPTIPSPTPIAAANRKLEKVQVDDPVNEQLRVLSASMSISALNLSNMSTQSSPQMRYKPKRPYKSRPHFRAF